MVGVSGFEPPASASLPTDLKSLNYHYGPKKRMIRNDLNGQ